MWGVYLEKFVSRFISLFYDENSISNPVWLSAGKKWAYKINLKIWRDVFAFV
jgi:hypothetical protein